MILSKTTPTYSLSCEAQAVPKPPRLHTTAREPKRAHFRVPAFKNTTKIPRKDPKKREEKKENCGGRGKKERNFGRSGGGEGVWLWSGQILDAPTKILNTPPTHPHTFTQHTSTTQHKTRQHTRQHKTTPTQHNTTHENRSGFNTC